MGNIQIHHCCIHDSNFKEVEDIESNKEMEKEHFKLLEKTIERAESFISDVSPSRRSRSKNDS
jgi:hypothetical protein